MAGVLDIQDKVICAWVLGSDERVGANLVGSGLGEWEGVGGSET